MSIPWLEQVSPRTRIWWMLFFALFPLAYVGGVVLEVAEQAPARMSGAKDRAMSFRIAEEFAAAKGFSVGGWHHYAIEKTDDNLLAYYGDAKSPDLATLSRLVPVHEVQILFRSSEGREIRVYLTLNGQVSGYDIGTSHKGQKASVSLGILNINTTEHQTMEDAAKDSNAAAAEAIARRDLSPALNGVVDLGTARISSNSDEAGRTNIEWDATVKNRPELSLNVKFGVRDFQIVERHITAKLDKSHEARKSRVSVLLNTAYGFFLAFCVFYALFRYAKRALQKEVSHGRTLVVAALFLISYSAHAYSLAFDQVATYVPADQFTKIALISCIASVIVFGIMGLLVGVAYGSGEGEVREAYQGKLTSLDALLAGRIFSRDVAASLLLGMAAAGWFLLLHNLLSLLFPTDSLDARSHVLFYTYARLPWLIILVGKQYDALLVAVAGLLLPGAFLLRSGSRKNRRFLWLIIFALCSLMHDAAAYSSLGSALTAMVVFAAALLLPFFTFDLLAAMVSFSALSYADELAQLVAVFPSWTGFATTLAIGAAALLLLATYLVFRGRSVREEDVRPMYAKNLAERMSMQAEILAAREAQLRLLPQSTPTLAGVQMAACCLPAHGLGGDFYDFFSLDANRAGIFVAQGGDEGLASALCIALAKGILMHNSLQSSSPTQIVVELEASLSELLEGGSTGRLSFAYGVMDTRRNTLNYARLGTSPRFVIHRASSGIASAAQLERAATIPERLRTARPVYEGAAHVQAGDMVIIYTDGVTSLRTRRFGKKEFQWLDILMREISQTSETLQASLVTALSKYQRQALNDLTAVVLRVQEVEAATQEGAA